MPWYMLMNWLPTYFELGLQVRHGIFKDDALLVGVIADHLITKRLLFVIKTRKLLNTIGFVVASFALMALPRFRTPGGVVFCSSVALGFLALGRAGFAVYHMDVAPRNVGIVMGQGNKHTAVTKSVVAHETGGTKREEIFVDVIEKISVTFSSSATKEIGALQVAKSKLEKEVEELTRQLQLEKCMRSGVHLVCGIVKDVKPQKIILSDGTDIPSGLLVWSKGLATHHL
ncbi:Uncharacterized protein Fot_35433 [Forsythia ovata]|uniref:Uncharacterized protein n=1 Tax=Forsythia ovata TaxID=205694 RepID=A0ABD1SLS8_9LAMI